MDSTIPSSDEIALRYLDQLPWPPYPFQEQAILTWFDSEDGILVCAPTGTGKTLIAETALYEALLTGRRAYYTTPLIALTEQKFRELQESAVRWGFSALDVGLVTGNRRENPDARILVVVAEILLNRLLSPEEVSFDDVSAVVMDEFHSFNDPERGIVWELSLGLLPKHTRLLLISATVGNATDFVVWLARQHSRKLRLLQSDERRVPLDFRWIADEMLPDQLEIMADGDDESRYTPALVFCFNRNECWSVAEQLKGKRLLADGQQKLLAAEIDQIDWSIGAGGKLRQFLLRGVGIHHAGLLPKYRRIIEKLFQKKLLSICVCTETLAAGINLPARSVVMTSLLKGPPRAMKLIEPSSAHQMFGRAGRPQFDTRGYVFAVAHEDDVRMFRWQQKYDEIPEDTKDPMLLRAKKNLKKKMPRRRDGQQFWTERQFQTLREAPPAKLASRGRFPWRLLAYFIRKAGTVSTLQDAVRRRLLDSGEKDDAEKQLLRMLITLEAGGFVTLDPPPPKSSFTMRDTATSAGPAFHSSRAGNVTDELLTTLTTATVSVRDSRWVSSHLAPMADEDAGGEVGEVIHFDSTEAPEDFGDDVAVDDALDSDEPDAPLAIEPESGEESRDDAASAAPTEPEEPPRVGLLGQMIKEARKDGTAKTAHATSKAKRDVKAPSAEDVMLSEYSPRLAIATEQMQLMLPFRSINAIYGVFLAEHMHKANYEERLQLLESALDLPSSVASQVRVPLPEQMPDGSLSTEFLNPLLLSRGIVTQQELTGYFDEVNRRRIYPLPLGDRMRMLFHSEYPGISDVYIRSVWCVGDLLRFGGNFDRYVRNRELTKQEGIMFRHCLRMVLLCGEFAQLEPPGLDPVEWRRDLTELAAILTETCRAVDPSSTDEIITTLRSQAEGMDHL
ncbi:MAG TPA: DEAD/DEAH box helicase [Planctomycetaceae bacterium]|nr:DEAD/DEAH box helicase [Planctomycetaceae bacterium]